MSPNGLHRYLDMYLSVREALGFQMRAARTLLRDLVGFLETRGDAGPIRAQWAIDWACTAATRRGTGSAAQRLSMARGFLTYLRASLPDTEVPDSGLVASFRRPTPYLLTPQQITALIQAAQQLGPQGSLRPHTISTVIGLLASTGLRVGEAIRLTTTDVRLEERPALVHIRETKFHKSRFVPLHPTTAAQLHHYRALRTALCYDAFTDVFFVSEQRHALTHKALGTCFSSCVVSWGCGPRSAGAAPACMPYATPLRWRVSARGIRRGGTCRRYSPISLSIWDTSVRRKAIGISPRPPNS
jgi:site-specific recombinase XerD